MLREPLPPHGPSPREQLRLLPTRRRTGLRTTPVRPRRSPPAAPAVLTTSLLRVEAAVSAGAVAAVVKISLAVAAAAALTAEATAQAATLVARQLTTDIAAAALALTAQAPVSPSAAIAELFDAMADRDAAAGALSDLRRLLPASARGVSRHRQDLGQPEQRQQPLGVEERVDTGHPPA